ncbi:FkbM family methyltransferase [Haloplanus salinarum]
MYSGWVRRAIRQTGLNKPLSYLYWHLLHLISDDIIEHRILDISVEFHTTTLHEYLRFRDLVGERAILEDVLISIQKDDIFYDVGANVGTYTCFVASKLESGQVISFEPVTSNTNRLRQNLELNGLSAETVQVALSDTNDTVEFMLSDDATGAGEHAIATDSGGQTIEVETSQGDSLIKRYGLPKPTVVKIDVEGAEHLVLQGLQTTLRDNCRLVYVEVHPEKISDFGGSESDVRSLLTQCGFEISEMGQRGNQIFLRAHKQDV